MNGNRKRASTGALIFTLTGKDTYRSTGGIHHKWKPTCISETTVRNVEYTNFDMLWW